MLKVEEAFPDGLQELSEYPKMVKNYRVYVLLSDSKVYAGYLEGKEHSLLQDPGDFPVPLFTLKKMKT